MRWTDEQDHDSDVREKGMNTEGHIVSIKVSGTFFEQVLLTMIAWYGEEVHVPIQTFIVVLSAEELHFLKRLRRHEVTGNRRMHGQEGVKSCRSSLLRTDNQKLGQLFTRLVRRPNSAVSSVETRIDPHWV